MRKFMLIAIVGMSLSSHAVAAEVTLTGTYKLVSEQRTIVDTGEERDALSRWASRLQAIIDHTK